MKLGRPCQANFSVQLQRPPTVNTKAVLKEIEKCCFWSSSEAVTQRCPVKKVLLIFFPKFKGKICGGASFY